MQYCSSSTTTVSRISVSQAFQYPQLSTEIFLVPGRRRCNVAAQISHSLFFHKNRALKENSASKAYIQFDFSVKSFIRAENKIAIILSVII